MRERYDDPIEGEVKRSADTLARGKSDQRSAGSSSPSTERLQKMPGPSTQERPRAHRLTDIESQATKVGKGVF